MAPLFHMWNAYQSHGNDTADIQVDHIERFINGNIIIRTEFCKSGIVDQIADIAVFKARIFTKSLNVFERGEVHRIDNDLFSVSFLNLF